jgi:hypothetical protein
MRTILSIFSAAVLLGFLPEAAFADVITCPTPTFQYGNQNQHTSNTYTVTPAVDCVWGTLGTQHLGNAQDSFLAGDGINDAAYGDSGDQFGLSWTLLGTTGGTSLGDLGNIGGLTFSNMNGERTFINWSIDQNHANFSGYNTFALGVKDGTDPQWSVFLLDSSQLSGTLTMTGGGFSHFTAYGANADDVVMAEPGSLVLLGVGLALFARSVRRKAR